MSVIIRLQNLPWSANSFDIRQFFQGLSIPEGGVHIVGGELGDAFIAFSTDEDARQAMMLSGGKLKEVQVNLLLSSRTEMQRVIEAARTISYPPAVVQPQVPEIPPAAVPGPVAQVRQAESGRRDSKENDVKKRSRSRSKSRDRSRNSRRDRRRRSRSRSRSRDRRDRRRRSKSRSRGRDAPRDRYGRDLEKRDDFQKSHEKEKVVAGENVRGPNQQTLRPAANNKFIPIPPVKTEIPYNKPVLPPQKVAPADEDPLSVAMKKTLKDLNIPIEEVKPSLKDHDRASQQVVGFANSNPPFSQLGIDGGFPDPGPAFGPNPNQPVYMANVPQFNPALLQQAYMFGNPMLLQQQMAHFPMGNLGVIPQIPLNNAGLNNMQDGDDRASARDNDMCLEDSNSAGAFDEFRTRFVGSGPPNSDFDKNSKLQNKASQLNSSWNERDKNNKFSNSRDGPKNPVTEPGAPFGGLPPFGPNQSGSGFNSRGGFGGTRPDNFEVRPGVPELNRPDFEKPPTRGLLGDKPFDPRRERNTMKDGPMRGGPIDSPLENRKGIREAPFDDSRDPRGASRNMPFEGTGPRDVNIDLSSVRDRHFDGSRGGGQPFGNHDRNARNLEETKKIPPLLAANDSFGPRSQRWDPVGMDNDRRRPDEHFDGQGPQRDGPFNDHILPRDEPVRQRGRTFDSRGGPGEIFDERRGVRDRPFDGPGRQFDDKPLFDGSSGPDSFSSLRERIFDGPGRGRPFGGSAGGRDGPFDGPAGGRDGPFNGPGGGRDRPFDGPPGGGINRPFDGPGRDRFYNSPGEPRDDNFRGPGGLGDKPFDRAGGPRGMPFGGLGGPRDGPFDSARGFGPDEAFIDRPRGPEGDIPFAFPPDGPVNDRRRYRDGDNQFDGPSSKRDRPQDDGDAPRRPRRSDDGPRRGPRDDGPHNGPRDDVKSGGRTERDVDTRALDIARRRARVQDELDRVREEAKQAIAIQKDSSCGLCVEVKECPRVPYQAVRRAFNGSRCPVEHIKYSESFGQRMVAVRFKDWPAKTRAIKLSHKLQIEGRYVVIAHLPDDEYEKLPGEDSGSTDRWKDDGKGRDRGDRRFNDSEPPKEGTDQCIKILDLPETMSAVDLSNIFVGFPMEKFHFITDPNSSKKSAVVKFSKEVNVRDAVASVPRSKYKIFFISDESYAKSSAPPGAKKKVENKPKEEEPIKAVEPVKDVDSECIMLKNLPSGVTDRDVCDFFSDIGIIPSAIHIMLGLDGKPSGEAYVEFQTKEAAKQAATKNGAPLGKINVSVTWVTRETLVKALEGPDEGLPHGPPMPGGMTGPRPIGAGGDPPPDCVVCLENVPFRADTLEIIRFFGRSFNIRPDNVFRKLNDRGQPTGSARVLFENPMEAMRAVRIMSGNCIRDRNVKMSLLCDGGM